MNDAVLQVRSFGAAFGDKVVHSDLSFDVPRRGVFLLVGPCGCGKSTLLRYLAGFNDANPSFRTWGSVRYDDAPLGMRGRPALVMQSARLMMSSVFDNIVHELPCRGQLTIMEQRNIAQQLLQDCGLDELCDQLDANVIDLSTAQQRHLAILRNTVPDPALLILDEPTTGINEPDTDRLLAHIQNEGAQRAVVVVLHNQQQLRRLGGITALLAGGCIQEVQATTDFLASPQSDAGVQYVRYGTCNVPSPDAVAENLDESIAPPPPLPSAARTTRADSAGPRGFLWLQKGVLAGTPLPGVVQDVEHDMEALQRVGITTLVSLTETPFDSDVLARYGMQGEWFPIPDMEPPGVNQAIALCETLDQLIARNEVVAVHCRAGLGRTGTALATYLIWQGSTGLEALEQVRRIEPHWVQSMAQVAFLEAFSRALADIQKQHTSNLSQSL